MGRSALAGITLSPSALPPDARKLEFAFENYPHIIVGLVSDSIRRLIAGHFEPADDPETISTKQHSLSDLARSRMSVIGSQHVSVARRCDLGTRNGRARTIVAPLRGIRLLA
jgi:hypothetical protein